jgi:hypothetical protein
MNTKSSVALKERTISESCINVNYLSQWPRGLACGHGYLSLVCVVWCQVEVIATGWSIVQRTDRAWCVWVWSWSSAPLGALAPWKINNRNERRGEVWILNAWTCHYKYNFLEKKMFLTQGYAFLCLYMYLNSK